MVQTISNITSRTAANLTGSNTLLFFSLLQLLLLLVICKHYLYQVPRRRRLVPIATLTKYINLTSVKHGQGGGITTNALRRSDRKSREPRNSSFACINSKKIQIYTAFCLQGNRLLVCSSCGLLQLFYMFVMYNLNNNAFCFS